MKIKLEYESDTLLPEEIRKYIIKMEKDINDNRYESDKINCYIMNLIGELIRWIDSNRIKKETI